ncbi:MAG TPA: LysR family transcriptional regulator [Candidatus Lachnoclostridium pullistercoris]|uniref:LysR family transcriptional regulator n=1 Tax=Candidatus Lachnoclostridium pullistercoris TaxID=2838632 RepID=A0A9D2T604_9FIRM|nr:LysR family transcriptional regulator [Candidatus Lachnoclostridium pullistercoris]
MDLRQLEYIVKIAEENNITRAAEKLFITQSALNQQLLRLEKELGTPLFYRSRTNWRPTEAGMVYLENARKILQIKHQTYSIISDMAATKKGRLSVGFTPGRGIDMFTAVYPAFHSQYPNIIIEPKEMSVHQQQQQISQGNLDIGFMTLQESDQTGDVYEIIRREEFVLAIPEGHPLGALAAPAGEPLAVLELSRLQYEPFVFMYKESTSRRLTDAVFRSAGFEPSVLFETSSTATIATLVRSRICCGVIPYYYVQKEPKGIAAFALPEHPAWNIAVSYRRGSYVSQAAKEFIRLAAEYWSAPPVSEQTD